MNHDKAFIAYELFPNPKVGLKPAPIARTWMDETPNRFAYRCLPMVIANQSGWMLHTASSVRAYWYGGESRADVQLEFDDPQASGSVVSVFGSGIITFTFPYLFRTPPGINLWVKGPSNWIKDGVQALEGVVEADWSTTTFTMNWKITRVGHWVEFRAGEPCCMLVPNPRGLAESLEPIREPLEANASLQSQYAQWQSSRSTFLNDLAASKPEAVKTAWQKDYFQGLMPNGDRFESHQTKLNLRPFGERESQLKICEEENLGSS